MLRLGVLAADVDVAALAARRVGGDRHRLDQSERVALHQHPILERARLRLVGVADEVVRPHGLVRDRLPLDAGREGCAAPALELRVLQLADHAFRAELDGAPKRRVAAVGAVLVEADLVRRGGAAEQAQRRIARLRQHGHRRRPGLAAGEHVEHGSGRRRRQRPLAGLVARIADERRRGAVALAEAGAAVPGRRAVRRELALAAEALLELRDQLVGAVAAAGDVLADVDDARRPRLDGEHRVERGDAVGVGRRDRQAAAELVEPAGADPADPLLQRPERGQQQVASRAGIVPRAGGVALGPEQALAAVPAVAGGAEHVVERGALGRRRLRAGNEVEIH